MESSKLLLDRKAAASMLSISVRALDRIIAAKDIRTRRIGRRVLVPASELTRYIKADHPAPLGA